MLKLFKFTLYIMFMSDDKGGGGGVGVGFVISTCRLNQLQICKETENISQSL